DMEDGPKKQERLQEFKVAQRLYLGRLPDGGVCLLMMDSKGRPRIRIAVDAEDSPLMEFLDEAGEVTYKFPAD
ncbi:MAG: hypothetical protein ACRDI1_02300, partial [Actinomycetota bacterium]